MLSHLFAVNNVYSTVDFSMTLPGVSLVRTRFKEFIWGDTHMLWITVKTRHLVNMLEVQFYDLHIVGNSGITIKRHPILDFALQNE